MGFDAIWITPVVQNADHYYYDGPKGREVGSGYHGYGGVDLYAIDPHFGKPGEFGICRFFFLFHMHAQTSPA